MAQHFIVIDDSELDCFIAEKMIRHTVQSDHVLTFTEASRALEHIRSQLRLPGSTPAILFLDVLMPVVSGFDFMETFEQLPANVRENYVVVALTSTMNKNDLSKISGYPSVRHLLDKPISAEALISLLEKIQEDTDQKQVADPSGK